MKLKILFFVYLHKGAITVFVKTVSYRPLCMYLKVVFSVPLQAKMCFKMYLKVTFHSIKNNYNAK